MVMGAFPSIRFLLVFVVMLCYVNLTMSCLESERQALLMFKKGLIDESNRLGSWVDVGGGSCCDWYGVSCNNSSGHIVGLHLQLDEYEAYYKTQFRGTISPSLLHLTQLLHLNLSGNYFWGIQIPSFLGLMTSLEQLDLSNAEFGGEIPSQIGKLTNLDYLGLGKNSLLSGDSLQWVSSLSLLHHLDLSNVDLSKARDWFHSINTIPFLSELILSECQLDHLLPSVPLLNNLSSLAVLDLSENYFRHSSIPKWIFHLHNLNTLDLSSCNFQAGLIPEGLQNLSRLKSLDLSYNNFNSSIPSWLYRFSSELEFLSLESNSLQGMISSSIGNLTTLTVLMIGGFNSGGLEIGGRETLKSMGQLCHLKHLVLEGVKVIQDVVDVFHDLFSSCPFNGLEELDLGSCGIFGNLTNVPLHKFKSLVTLSLESNFISGSIPLSFGELQSLETAYIGDNSMAGVISEAHFRKLDKLKTFTAESNKRLEMEVSPSWIPPFQLTHLSLGSSRLGKHFPHWLRTQKDMQFLNLSDCGIEDTIPSWFWNLSWPIWELTLSGNSIFGEIPSMAGQAFQETVTHLAGVTIKDGVRIDLSSNQLTGQVPILSSKVQYLDLSNNSFESISKGFWNSTNSLNYLFLAHNRIVGEIPSSWSNAITDCVNLDLSSNYFTGQVPPLSNMALLDLSSNSFSGSMSHLLCNGTNILEILNLGDNLLSGEIPDCWNAWKYLRALKLNNNNFTGGFPSSMQNLSVLESLHVRNNSLTGGLPLLLRSNQNLLVVDLAENQLEGEIPAWIGESNLIILDLRSNKFHGRIPDEVCSLASLQILDFASNNLTGNIPQCIKELQALVTGAEVVEDLLIENDPQEGIHYADEATVVMKARVMEYGNTLNLVRLIDLSDNSLSGDIPAGVTILVALQSLNLSHNFLTGEIPQEIGAMKKIESLDLSMNKLSGEIPESITNLTFLSYLNLSSNKLKGPIPLSTQLQGFDASCFAGNDLCGLPLAKSCTPIAGTTTGGSPEHGHHDHVKWFWVSAAFGFVLGFWVVVFPVFYSRRWRLAFFGVLDSIWDFLLVIFGRYYRF